MQRFHLVPKLTALAKNQFGNETKTSVNESPLTRELFAGTMVTVYTLYSEFGRLGRDRASEESYCVSGVRRPVRRPVYSI